jgi:hypothetical protein
MTRTIIASVVGAVILFIYQFLSWEVSPMHANSFKYVADQDAVMTALSQHLNEDGVYAMPMPPPGSDMKTHEDLMKKNVGKPTAMIFYHSKMGGEMISTMIFGFLINLISVLIVVLILNKLMLPGFGGRLMATMAFALFVVFQTDLMNLNWFHTPWHFISIEIADILLGWLITGIWLAWYTGMKTNAKQGE